MSALTGASSATFHTPTPLHALQEVHPQLQAGEDCTAGQLTAKSGYTVPTEGVVMVTGGICGTAQWEVVSKGVHGQIPASMVTLCKPPGDFKGWGGTAEGTPPPTLHTPARQNRYDCRPAIVGMVRLCLAGALALAALLVVSWPASAAPAVPPAAPSPIPSAASVLMVPHTRSPIQHVIIIIQENHAFDNYFSQYPGAFGLPPGGVPQPTTLGAPPGYASEYPMDWNYGNNQSFSSPAHGEDNILSEEDNGSMDGFYYTNGAPADGLYPPYIVSNDLGLAQEYGLADNYYTDFAGPTLPNRFYYYAITSGPVTGDANPPGDVVSFPSLPAMLQQNGISWTSFDGNYNEYPGAPCFYVSLFPTCPSWYFSFPTSSLQLSQLSPILYFNWIQNEYNQNGSIPQVQYYNNIYGDISSGTLPSVSWFTSDWICCTEHPDDSAFQFIGGNVSQGQQSFLTLVQAVEDSPYWNNTAIFLTYDEGGGFFDHNPSPRATPLGTGLRVPLIVISPYSREGYVSHAFYTPSSLLHFIEWNWNLPSLGALDNSSNLPLDFFNFSAPPRPPLPSFVYGSSDLTGQFPWNYTQPVPLGDTGTYQPALVTTKQVNWAFQTSNSLLSAPDLSGTTVFICGMDGTLRAFEPVTGAELWSRPLGSGCRSSPTSLPGGGIAVTTLLGNAMAFNGSGTPLWNLSLGAPMYGNLTPVGGTLYGTLQNGTVFAVNGTTGTLLWEKHVTNAAIYASPVYDPLSHTLLLSATTDGVVDVNLTGAPLWTAGIPGGVSVDGALCGADYYVTTPGFGFFGGPPGGLYPISAVTGTVGNPAPLEHSMATPLCVGNTLYVGDNATFRAYSLPSLAPLWNASILGEAAGTPSLVGDTVAVDTQGGDLYLFPVAGGPPSVVLASRSSMFGSVLSLPSGQYFTAEDGNLYARVTGGEVRVHVSPANATVHFDGAPVPLTGGNGRFLASAGAHALNATLPGYIPLNITVQVSADQISTVNLTLSALPPPPVITAFNASPDPMYLGDTLSFQVSVKAGAPPYAYTYTGLPVGCSSENTSALSCLPTTVGNSSVRISVRDLYGRSATAITNVEVQNVPPPSLAIASLSAVPNPVTLGGSTMITVDAQGGTLPYQYRYTGLPTGCYTQDSATVSCTPTQAGNFKVSIVVTDSHGVFVAASLTLSVLSGPTTSGWFTGGTPLFLLLVLIVVAAAVVLVLFARRRRVSPTPRDPPPPPPPFAAGPAAGEWVGPPTGNGGASPPKD